MERDHVLTELDEGKRVVNAGGEKVGLVTKVSNGTAYVDPDPDVFDTIKATLGWEEIDEDSYPLRGSDVSEVTGNEIRLRRP